MERRRPISTEMPVEPRMGTLPRRKVGFKGILGVKEAPTIVERAARSETTNRRHDERQQKGIVVLSLAVVRVSLDLYGLAN